MLFKFFHDFQICINFQRLFHDFPRKFIFPGFSMISMTVGTLRMHFRRQAFCFNYMLKTNSTGKYTIWGGTKIFGVALPPNATPWLRACFLHHTNAPCYGYSHKNALLWQQ